MVAPLPSPLELPTAAVPSLRPMTLGEVLDRALAIFRANFSRLLLMMLAFQAPMYALRKGMQSLTENLAHLGKAPELSAVLILLGQLALAFGGMLLIHQFAVAAHASAAARAFLGERVAPGKAIKEMLGRSLQILGAFFLVMVLIALASALAMLPGVAILFAPVGNSSVARVLVATGLALFGALVATLYLALRFALVTEVLMIERLSLFAALRRSGRLMAGRSGPSALDGSKLRASIVYAVNLCISIAVAVTTSLPNMLVSAAYGVSPFNPEAYDPSRIPFWALLPGDILQVFASAAITPFGLLAMVVFYFDLRIKREGFDLEVLAGRVKGAP